MTASKFHQKLKKLFTVNLHWSDFSESELKSRDRLVRSLLQMIDGRLCYDFTGWVGVYQKKPMIGILDQIVEVLDEKTLDLQVPLRELMLSDLSPAPTSTPTPTPAPTPARAPAPVQSPTSSLLPGSPSFAFGSLPRYKSADSEKTQVLPDEAVSSPALDAKALERAMTVSRRSEQRVPAVGPMMILNQDGEYISKGEGRNISSKGIGAKIFNCQKRIVVGDLVVLEIYGNKALKPFRAEAKVLICQFVIGIVELPIGLLAWLGFP